MEVDGKTNRREHIRFALNTPLLAELSIWRVGERRIDSRMQRVILNNISAGGCQFATNLRIPVRDDVEWQLKMRMGLYTTALRATIRYAQTTDGMLVYGACWIMSELERQTLKFRLTEYMQQVLVSSPQIHRLYQTISARKCEGQFKKLDVTL